MRKGHILAGAVLLLCYATLGSNLTTVFNFEFGQFAISPTGRVPDANLIQGADGNLYGTTSGSYLLDQSHSASGTVFKLALSGDFQRLEPLPGSLVAEYLPQGPLVVRHYDGNLYGTTLDSSGTEFTIAADGTFTTVAAFSASNPLGPTGGIIEGSDGNFYGTSSRDPAHAWGQVFQLTANGRLTTLHAFTNGADGARSYSGLLEVNSHSFYGTTSLGGPNNQGTIFRTSPTGDLAILYSFQGKADGSSPYAGLAVGDNGSLYGTTQFGGTNHTDYGGDGTIFVVTTNGQLTTLYSFDGTNGACPRGALVRSKNGDLFGTTLYGGIGYHGSPSSGNGTVFKVDSKGVMIVLHFFGEIQDTNGFSLDGANPQAGLTLATNGQFYGMTQYGGTHNVGTVFCFQLSREPLQVANIFASKEAITFSWNTVPAAAYQAQYATNLAQAVWNNLGPTLNATGSVQSFSDSRQASQQRFYRVVLLP